MADAAEKIQGTSDNELSSSTSSKIIKLFEDIAQLSKEHLSAHEQEEIILEFRIKARKLARSILRKWRSRLDLEEVDSVVDLSLCEAVRRFDPEKGASFMTFLYYHLKGNLVRTVSAAANANVIPTDGEDGEQIVHAYDVVEALTSTEVENPDEMLLKKELIRLSQGARSELDDLEREVIQRIYIEGQHLIDIASSLGYSRCHISRVKKKALQTLQFEINARLSSEDESSKALSSPHTKKVHRRKPRSKKAKEKLSLQSEDILEAA